MARRITGAGQGQDLAYMLPIVVAVQMLVQTLSQTPQKLDPVAKLAKGVRNWFTFGLIVNPMVWGLTLLMMIGSVAEPRNPGSLSYTFTNAASPWGKHYGISDEWTIVIAIFFMFQMAVAAGSLESLPDAHRGSTWAPFGQFTMWSVTSAITVTFFVHNPLLFTPLWMSSTFLHLSLDLTLTAAVLDKAFPFILDPWLHQAEPGVLYLVVLCLVVIVWIVTAWVLTFFIIAAIFGTSTQPTLGVVIPIYLVIIALLFFFLIIARDGFKPSDIRTAGVVALVAAALSFGLPYFVLEQPQITEVAVALDANAGLHLILCGGCFLASFNQAAFAGARWHAGLWALWWHVSPVTFAWLWKCDRPQDCGTPECFGRVFVFVASVMTQIHVYNLISS